MKTRLVLMMTIMALMLTIGLIACSGAKQEAAPAAAPSALDGEALVQERCTQCHDLGRVESATKTRDEWKANVERMVALGAQLDEAEQEAAIGYLAEAHPK